MAINRLSKIIFIVLFTSQLFSCATANKKKLDDPSQCMKFLFANDTKSIEEYSDDCINYRSEENEVTLLMMAVAKGNMEMAQFLIANQANVNAVNSLKQNALHYAVIHNKPKMIRLLRSNDGQIVQNIHGITSLMMAIQLGTFEMVEQLNPSYEDINTAADDGWTALYFAIRKQDPQILDYLLERGACINFSDDIQTPIEFATTEKWTYAVEKLKTGKRCDKY